MLGIAVNIWRPIDPPGTPAHARRGFIGGWEATGIGMAGLEWLEHLVAEARATSLGGSGYPYIYKIRASILAEALRSGVPHGGPGVSVIVGENYVARSGTVTDFTIDQNALGGCPPEEELLVEAWDLS